MRTSIILCLGLLLQATPKELIEKLHSDRVEDRDAASAELKKLDASALPLLEAAAKDPDPEVSRRAGVALRIIRLRDSLTPGLRKVSPGIEERLALGGDEAYTAAFLALVLVRPDIPSSDLEALAVRALRGATVQEQPRVLSYLHGRNLSIAVPDIRPLLHSEDDQVYRVAEVTLVALAPESARETFVDMTKERSPALRCRGIASLERCRMRDQIPRIAALVVDPDVQVRSEAIDALGTLGAHSEIPRLTKLVRDEDNRVRSSAANALLNLDAREAIPALLTLLRSPSAIEDSQLVDVLTGLGALEAAPAIAERLKSTQGDRRSASVRALADLGATDQAARILPLLDDEDKEVRADAIWAVARFGLRDASDRIVKFLGDDDFNVRCAAAWAAGRLRLTAAVPGLTRLLAEQQGLPISAIWALGELRVKEALPRLLELAAQSSDIGHVAAEAIGAIGEPLSAAQLLTLMGSPNEHVPVALLPVLGHIPQEHLLPTLLRDAGGDDLEKKQRALQHIGLLKLGDGAPALLKVLRDVTQDSVNRVMAADSLAQLQRKEVVQELDALMKDDRFPDHPEVIQILARLEGRERLLWLKTFLKNQYSNVQIAALRALEERGSSDVLECALPFLTNNESNLDVAAASWLCRSGHREGVEVLLRDVEAIAPINGVRNPAGWKKLAAVKLDGILRGSRFDIAERIAREAGLRFSWTWIAGDDDVSARVELRYFNSDPASKSGATVLEEMFRANGNEYSFLVEGDLLRILPGFRAHEALRNWYESTKPR